MQLFATDLHGFVDHLPGWTGHGDALAVEGRLTHFDPHQLAIIQHLRQDFSTRRQDAESGELWSRWLDH